VGAIGICIALVASIPLFGCKSSMSTRKDAANDANLVDAAVGIAADLPVAPDLAQAIQDVAQVPDLPPDLAPTDVPSPDSASPLVTPTSFRFDNHTSRTAYVPSLLPVSCRTQDATGAWRDCSFSQPWCTPSCSVTGSLPYCCEECDSPIPRLIPVPPGESRSVAWNGHVFNRNSTLCSQCSCAQELPAPAGGYEASALVYSAYRCESAGCSLDSSGVIVGANPQGPATGIAVPFAIPSGSAVVVLGIEALDPDAMPPAFAAVPGGSFKIAAADTPPDASTQEGLACKPSDATAHYQLVFSADAASVSIVRADPVQEVTMTGTLTSRSDTHLLYRLTNLFAGGELIVEKVDAGLRAQLVIFGSGRPVVSCIDSPMTKLWLLEHHEGP
jgi:hypothetical protein